MQQNFNSEFISVTDNLIFKLHIPENNFGKINGTFRHIEDRVGQLTTKRQLIRKAYFISVELIENVMKYGVFTDAFENNFQMAHRDDKFIFSSSNLVDNKDIIFIKTRLNEINSVFDHDNSEDLLKEMYKNKLSKIDSSDNDVKIGIIELARRLDNKILFNFKKIDDKHSAFCIICTVVD